MERIGESFADAFKRLRASRGMSLRQLAGQVYADASYLCKIENGKRRPSAELVRAIDAALAADGELIALHTGPAGGAGSSPAAPTGFRYVSGDEALMMMTADESADHGHAVGYSNISDAQLDEFDAVMDQLATDVLTAPLIPVVSEARRLRDDVFRRLDGRQYPRQSRRLYGVAARTCGLLAEVAADRLRLYDAALRHAETAHVAAELSEDPPLEAWASSKRSAVLFWQGRYRAAGMVARAARMTAPPGAEAARLASLEARAYAKLGDHEAVCSALDAARSARDEAGPAAGVGFIAFPLSNQIRLAGTAHLWAGDHARARTDLSEALRLLEEEYDSVAHMAAARADLALACLRCDALDEAEEVLRPLLDAASDRNYLGGTARRIADLTAALRGPRYFSSASARWLGEQVEGFAAAQATNGEAVEAGVTSNHAVPR